MSSVSKSMLKETTYNYYKKGLPCKKMDSVIAIIRPLTMSPCTHGGQGAFQYATDSVPALQQIFYHFF